MGKLTRKSAPRGTKLQTNQWNDPLSQAKAAIETPSLSVENLAHTQAMFSLNISIPRLDSRIMEYKYGRYAQPFVLPPLQDEWNTSRTCTATTPRPRLRAISISCDQRAEGKGISDLSTTHETNLTDADMTRYSLTIEILEKPLAMGQTTLNDTSRFIRTVYAATIPGVEAFGTPGTFPILTTNMSEVLDPYAGYWIVLTARDLYTNLPATDNLAIPSLNLNLTFDRVIRQRQIIQTDIQNLPTQKAALPQPSAVTLSLPTSNSIITAAQTSGNIETIDEVLQSTLDAGWMPYSRLPVTEQTTADSHYSVIHIPMWSNWYDLRASDVATKGLPYTTAPNYVDPTTARNFIRLPDGFVLHHIVWHQSHHAYPSTVWATLQGNPQVQASLHHRVGIALVQGLRSDSLNYQQAAYLDLDGSNLEANLVDRLAQQNDLTTLWDGSLYSLPMVYEAGSPSNFSYYPTGQSIYVGKGDAVTQARTNIHPQPNGAASTPPTTGGQETHLEIRWQIQDAVLGLNDPAHVSDIRLGYGGGSLILVGLSPLKKV